MFLRKSLTPVVILILVLCAVAIAQQPQDRAPDGSGGRDRQDRMGQSEGRRHGGMGRHRGREFPGLRELNLTDDQTQQQRAIAQRHLETIKSQREELSKLREKRMQGTFTADDEARAKLLRQDIDNSRQSMLTEIEGILTPEQRTKLEQMKAERKLRHEDLRKRHKELESSPQQ